MSNCPADLYIRSFPCAAHIITFQHLETHGGRTTLSSDNNYLKDMWKQAHTPFFNREMKPTVNRPLIRAQALKNLILFPIIALQYVRAKFVLS